MMGYDENQFRYSFLKELIIHRIVAKTSQIANPARQIRHRYQLRKERR
jgi:hypothetical protein